MITFSQAIANGALGQLTHLILNYNHIGDPGMISLADALKPTPSMPMGALGQLETLYLQHNRISDDGMQ
eukprot:1138091-Prymnesium_polylepis.1